MTAKALADPTRLRILAALRRRDLCVCELCDSLSVTQSTLSTHLQVIRAAGLVDSRKHGKWMYYKPSAHGARAVTALFRAFPESLNGDARLRRDASNLRRRLSLRRNDSCCVGFCRVKPARQRSPR